MKNIFTLLKANIQIVLSITFHLGPEHLRLQLILKRLEKHLVDLDSTKTELEKLLSDFQHMYTMELGDIILKILNLRLQLFKSDESKWKEAYQDERNFREQVVADKKQPKHHVTPNEKKELKKKFRKASILCHPDKVEDLFKTEARDIFVNLKQAYDSNDLKAVNEILYNLEKGNYFKLKSESFSEKELLKTEIENIRIRINKLEKEISDIKKSDQYKRVISIRDWKKFFSALKTKLENELDEMQQQSEILSFKY